MRPHINTDNQTVQHSASHGLPFMVVLLLTFIFVKTGFSQSFNPLISYSVESCTLDVALEKLFAEYELNVAFSKAEMSKIRIEKYSCSYKSVDEVLTDLLNGTGYGFKRIGKQYVIKKNQALANDPQGQVSAPPVNVVEQPETRADVVVNKTTDTVRIFDTVQLIKTVMRHDTVVKVQHEVKTDTVYQVQFHEIEPKWPWLRETGWFITPSVSVGVMHFQHLAPMPEPEDIKTEVDPILAYAFGLDGGYKHKRLSAGVNLSYRSVRYRFLLEQTLVSGGYYENDTLDIYYTVHPSGDTTYQYILDSTYIPSVSTSYSYRDVNRLDYLTFGLFASYDFVELAHLRAYVKAGASLDVLVKAGGSLNATESPYHRAIDKSQVEPVHFSWFAGVGVALMVTNHMEVTPEVRYRMTVKPLYRVEYPFDIKMHTFDFRLGLTYYF